MCIDLSMTVDDTRQDGYCTMCSAMYRMYTCVQCGSISHTALTDGMCTLCDIYFDPDTDFLNVPNGQQTPVVISRTLSPSSSSSDSDQNSLSDAIRYQADQHICNVLYGAVCDLCNRMPPVLTCRKCTGDVAETCHTSFDKVAYAYCTGCNCLVHKVALHSQRCDDGMCLFQHDAFLSDLVAQDVDMCVYCGYTSVPVVCECNPHPEHGICDTCGKYARTNVVFGYSSDGSVHDKPLTYMIDVLKPAMTNAVLASFRCVLHHFSGIIGKHTLDIVRTVYRIYNACIATTDAVSKMRSGWVKSVNPLYVLLIIVKCETTGTSGSTAAFFDLFKEKLMMCDVGCSDVEIRAFNQHVTHLNKYVQLSNDPILQTRNRYDVCPWRLKSVRLSPDALSTTSYARLFLVYCKKRPKTVAGIIAALTYAKTNNASPPDSLYTLFGTTRSKVVGALDGIMNERIRQSEPALPSARNLLIPIVRDGRFDIDRLTEYGMCTTLQTSTLRATLTNISAHDCKTELPALSIVDIQRFLPDYKKTTQFALAPTSISKNIVPDTQKYVTISQRVQENDHNRIISKGPSVDELQPELDRIQRATGRIVSGITKDMENWYFKLDPPPHVWPVFFNKDVAAESRLGTRDNMDQPHWCDPTSLRFTVESSCVRVYYTASSHAGHAHIYRIISKLWGCITDVPSRQQLDEEGLLTDDILELIRTPPLARDNNMARIRTSTHDPPQRTILLNHTSAPVTIKGHSNTRSSSGNLDFTSRRRDFGHGGRPQNEKYCRPRKPPSRGTGPRSDKARGSTVCDRALLVLPT